MIDRRELLDAVAELLAGNREFDKEGPSWTDKRIVPDFDDWPHVMDRRLRDELPMLREMRDCLAAADRDLGLESPVFDSAQERFDVAVVAVDDAVGGLPGGPAFDPIRAAWGGILNGPSRRATYYTERDVAELRLHPSDIQRQYAAQIPIDPGLLDALLAKAEAIPVDAFGEDDAQQHKATTPTPPRPCDKIAYSQYRQAVDSLDQHDLTDTEAYEEARRLVKCDGEEIPEFETWVRYVRRARKHHGEQKNAPRGARQGRSVSASSDL